MARFFAFPKILCIFVLTFQSLAASTLIIVNNSSNTLFVSDGIEIGAVLTPSQQYIAQDTNLITLFFYQAERVQAPQTFKLICRLKELVSSSQPTTIYWTDIASKSLHARMPGRFEIVPQMRLKFQQEHGAQLGVGKQQQTQLKGNQAKVGSRISQQATVATTTSSEPTQAVVDALMSQFLTLQQNQKSVDTADLKPKRTPPSKPQVSRKK